MQINLYFMYLLSQSFIKFFIKSDHSPLSIISCLIRKSLFLFLLCVTSSDDITDSLLPSHPPLLLLFFSSSSSSPSSSSYSIVIREEYSRS